MEEKNKHANIPIFIPHLGCMNKCVFCNQRSISGCMEFDRLGVEKEIEKALATISLDTYTEIAFFGGSFTGIDRELMIYLLEVAYRYVLLGRVDSIRLSTRPDYISREILEILKRYGVKTIELGLQSMSEKVLLASKRGHTTESAYEACALIKEYGFELIGQMMIGLPESTLEDEVYTAREICRMGADGARIYPTVVFYDTELCDMAKGGSYSPLDTESAIERSKNALRVFSDNDIPCIRIGLCASENLSSKETVYAGPNDSALGELVMGELFFEKTENALEKIFSDKDENLTGDLVIYVPEGSTSKVIGHRKKNFLRLKNKYFVKKCIKSVRIVELDTLKGYNIKIEFLASEE